LLLYVCKLKNKKEADMIETTQTQEDMNPADMAEWLAVHELDAGTSAFNQTRTIEETGNESYPYELVTDERVRGLGYLASLHNNRAETELEEIVTSGPNHMTQTADAALILAEINGDPKWLHKALDLSDAIAVKGFYDGHKYRAGASNEAEEVRRKTANVAVKLGFTDELKEELSTWGNEKASKLMLGYIENAEKNRLDETASNAPEIDEPTQARINEILATVKDGEIDKSFDSVDSLPSKTARLVAYQAIAEAVRN
jgi:hypothetical protein